MKRGELTARLALLGAAFLAALFGAPAVVLAPLGALSLLATAHLAGSGSPRDTVDRVLRGAGFLLCAGVLGGLALALVPHGLTRPGWAVYWLAVGLAVLRQAARLASPGWPRPSAGWLVPGVAVALVTVAFGLSTVDAGHRHSRPLALWLVGRGGAGVTVAVDGRDAPINASWRIVLADQASGQESWSSRPFGPDGGTVRQVTVPVPHYGRWRIELVPVGDSAAVRELILTG